MNLASPQRDTTKLVTSRPKTAAAAHTQRANVTPAGRLYLAALRYLAADKAWDRAYDKVDNNEARLWEADTKLVDAGNLFLEEACDIYFGSSDNVDLPDPSELTANHRLLLAYAREIVNR